MRKVTLACLWFVGWLSPLWAGPRVAVYDIAADGGRAYETNVIAQALKAQAGLGVELIPDLALERLLRYDVLVVPYGGLGNVAGGQVQVSVPTFIEAGGGVLSCFGNVGGGYPPAKEETLFPPVASFAGELKFFKAKSLAFKSVGSHPIAEGIDELRPSTPPKDMDWLAGSAFVLKRERRGQIAFADPEMPYYGLVIAGTYGAGRVVASGLLLGSTDAAGVVTIDEAKGRLLVNSVRWLAAPARPPANLREYATERLAEVEALVATKAQALQQRAEKLKGAETEANQRGVQLSALKQQIAAVYALVRERTRGFAAGLASAESKLKTARARPLGQRWAEVFLALNTLALQVRKESVKTLLRVDEVTNEVHRRAGVKFPRSLPRFPRIVFHVLQHVRMEDIPSDLVMDKYLREVAEELHANMEAGHVEDIRRPGDWSSDEKMMSRYLAYCQAHGIQWFAFTTNPLGTNLATNGALELYARSPAFAGLLIDEPIYLLGKGNYGMTYPQRDEHFRAFLEKNYRAEELRELLIDPRTVRLNSVQDIALLKDQTAVATNPLLKEVADPRLRSDCQKVLWMVAGEFFRDELRRLMEVPVGQLKRADPGLTAWINLNVFPWFSYGASLPANSEICDVIGFDPYSSGAIQECVLMEMARGCGKKVWGIAYGGGDYTLNQSLYRRHLYNFVLHAEGVGVFAWNVMYKHQHGWGSSRPYWSPGFWEMTREVFANVEKAEDYLANRRSIARVAVLVSERTMWGNYFVPWGGRGPGARYYENLVALYAALQQLHVPVDMVFAENIERLDLLRYAVVLCPTADCLQDSELERLRDWVKAGGVLVATARTSACDRYGRNRNDYALSDVFHASWLETRSGHDTMSLAAAPLGCPTASLEYGGDERDVLRDLPGSTVIGRWRDGTVATVMGEYGKGACIFTGATFVGLGYEGLGSTLGWPARYRFSPGVREFLGACVNWGLKRCSVEPGLLVEEDLPDLMVDLRSQKPAEGKERLVIQFLDYGDAYTLDTTKAKSVPFKSGVPADCYLAHPHRAFTLRVRVPEDWKPGSVKVHNPLRRKAVRAKVERRYVAFRVDEFALFDMVVLENRTPEGGP